MIVGIHGLPGTGKNVYATALAIKSYNKTNSFINRFIRRIRHQPLIFNNIYSSYPILLDKKRNIYTHVVSPYNLTNEYSFLPHATIIIDEIQSFYDSDEFKEFPKAIAVFNQFHRHFNIDNIYYISQHPSRVVKKLRNVICEYRRINFFIKLPLLPFGFVYYTNYYEFEDYGKWNHPSKELKTYDVDNHFFFFNVKRVFNSYDSVYLHVLNDPKPLLFGSDYSSLDLSEDDVLSIFGGDIWH